MKNGLYFQLDESWGSGQSRSPSRWRKRFCVERVFGYLKINLAIATRYDQLEKSLLGMLFLDSARYWLRLVRAAEQIVGYGQAMTGDIKPSNRALSQKVQLRQNVYFWVLLAIFFIAIMLDVVFSPSLSGNDDLSIASAATRIVDQGIYVPHSHYAARFGLTIPLAAIFELFGTGVTLLNVIPLSFCLMGLYCAYRLGTVLFDRGVGLLSAAVLGCYPLYVEYSKLYFPDAIQGVLLAAAVLLAISHSGSGHARLIRDVASGACWAYAYYVKIDAFFLGVVFLAVATLGYMRWRSFFVICGTAGVLVGAELAYYGVVLGSPFYHFELERAASNEVLSQGLDYRNLFTYPKAMFITVYETGIHFYLLAAAILLALVTKNRPAVLLSIWIAVFFVWLLFGFDPIGASTRLKPQLVRYLLDFAVPMCVLIGWTLKYIWDRVSPWLTGAISAATVAVAVLFMAFNQLNYESALATQRATEAALRSGWFPLYPDIGSAPIVAFMLHNSRQNRNVHFIHHHNFLTGKTTFDTIYVNRAYLMINYDTQRQLQARNFVVPLDPSQFGMRVTQVVSIDNPAWGISYNILRLLARLGEIVPVASIREHMQTTAHEVLRPGDAKIYRLQR